MLTWFFRMITGSRTIALAIQLMTIVARGIDKGFKNETEKLAGFVYDRLPEEYQERIGSKDDLEDLAEHAVAVIDGLWKILHRDEK